MNNDIEIIKQQAIKMGACRLIESVSTFETLAKTLMSPQGIEFFSKRLESEPILDMFRTYKKEIRKYGVYVDSTRNVYPNGASNIFVGKSTRAIADCHGTRRLYTIVVMDKARVTINARNYAVIRLYDLGGQVEIINDGTAKIL